MTEERHDTAQSRPVAQIQLHGRWLLQPPKGVRVGRTPGFPGLPVIWGEAKAEGIGQVPVCPLSRSWPQTASVFATRVLFVCLPQPMARAPLY